MKSNSSQEIWANPMSNMDTEEGMARRGGLAQGSQRWIAGCTFVLESLGTVEGCEGPWKPS